MNKEKIRLTFLGDSINPNLLIEWGARGYNRHSILHEDSTNKGAIWGALANSAYNLAQMSVHVICETQE